MAKVNNHFMFSVVTEAFEYTKPIPTTFDLAWSRSGANPQKKRWISSPIRIWCTPTKRTKKQSLVVHPNVSLMAKFWAPCTQSGEAPCTYEAMNQRWANVVNLVSDKKLKRWKVIRVGVISCGRLSLTYEVNLLLAGENHDRILAERYHCVR